MTLFERRLRLGTGLFLVVYTTQHLLNHSLGLISFELMEGVRQLLAVFWRNPVVNAILYACLLAHFLLALWSLFKRSSLKMPRWELAQVVFGLSIVPLLSGHATANWGSRVLFEIEVNYYFTITGIFSNGWYIVRQFLLVCVAWLHVCVGLHFWLRMKRWYKKYLPTIYILAVLIPLLALLAVTRISFELSEGEYLDVYDGAETDESFLVDAELTPAQLSNVVLVIFYGLLGATLAARWARFRFKRRLGVYTISHPSGKRLVGLKGQTLLDTIRSHGVPHASVCGGRARCTTCRVRVGRGLAACPQPNALEQQALKRIKAAPNVRLACQTCPVNDVQITPLVAAAEGMSALRRPGAVQGTEQQVVAMFVDLRGSTQLGEQRLPYDVLFVLNRFFSEMAEVLQQTHGHYAQFAGDGLMALYGLSRGLQQGCRDALQGATRMQQRIDRLNEYFKEELNQPLRIGIGVHCGEAIVGTMGPPRSPNYSAIGDNINTAARLESLTKEFGCTLVVSAPLIDQAGYTLDVPLHSVTVRGKTQSLEVYAIDVDALPTIADSESI